MNRANGHYHRLKALLQIAYKEKEAFDVGDHWKTEVMRRIRGLAPPEVQVPFLRAFGSLAWRLAPATGALILILSAVLAASNLSGPDDFYQLITYEFSETGIADLLALR
ncbi:MAG: hypothetical protein ACOWWM_16590 [Desulfobacterales bacterium]